ncbi:MAG: flagellar basal body rod protein FlgC [Geminicoccaceae bacterium]|nr:flagellar basal body rod protein FlgC [Geminicoccaceae bacterium]MCB9942354.1 flagellar basal body rod protein FlgC [Geminicoccaceae bacterium]
MSDLETSMRIAAAGMKVQSARLRVSSENLANAQSTAIEPGGEAYRRKTIEFGNQLDRELGVELVEVAAYGVDSSEQPKEFDPDNRAADADGYVALPNVNPLTELMDMREAQRSYEANLGAMKQARSMLMKMIDILRG